MKRSDRSALSGEAQRELETLDAALAGENVPAEHARLAELATTLRELRARPREEFVDVLDAKAARGFRRGERAPRRRLSSRDRRSSSSRLASLLTRPSSALAVAALVALAVAVPLLSSGGHRPGTRAVPAGSFSAPGFAESVPLAGSARSTLKAAPAEPAPSAPSTEKNAAASGQLSSGIRLIERTATMDVGVAPGAIESTAQRVFTLVSAYGGYVRQSSVSSGEAGRGAEPLHGEEGQRGGASFDIRVPSANLSDALAALAHLGHVRSENNTTNDVTDQHASLRGALGEVQAERSSVLAQLRKATDEGEIAVLKSRLHTLDERIGQLQGQLRSLDQRVTYTSLAFSLTPESSSAGAGSGDLTPGGAAHDAAAILDAALAVFVLAAAALLPLAAIVTAGSMTIAATRRRLRERALDAG